MLSPLLGWPMAVLNAPLKAFLDGLWEHKGEVAREVTMAPKGRGEIRKIQIQIAGKGVMASGPGMRRGLAKIVVLLWEGKSFGERS